MNIRLMWMIAAAVLILAGCGNEAANRNNKPVAPENQSTAKPEQAPVQPSAPNQESIELSFTEAFGGMSFDTPIGIRHAPDMSGRLFVLEQPGRIIALSGDVDNPRKEVYLDLSDLVHDEGWEQGLLGLAFHPRFKENGKFYVNYTTETATVIAEYRQSEEDGDRADADSGRILISFEQPYDNHNGGELAFGPDGYLYIAAGDGGSSGDPQGNAQNTKSWLGKIHRIDVDRQTQGKPYAVPDDNPFFGNDRGELEEIYAYGLRNPWRFSFDSETGLLWAADVGQNRYEEINLIERGGNYGWNVMEGNSCYEPADNCEMEGLIPPIFEYEPEEGGASITGGYVYRGEAIPALNGRYLFADFMDGRVWTLSLNEEETQAEAQQAEWRLPGVTSFGTDENGEIYACLYDGRIVRLTAGSAAQP